jgi:SOS-response transcriptional repressor LexA
MARPKAKMTERWDLVLRFIKAYIRLNNAPPSYEILARGLGMRSRSNMHRIVKRLKEEGLLETKPRKYLSIRVVDRSVKEISKL